jgi:hypothetical protein
MDRNTQHINHILILLALFKQDIKAQTHMNVFKSVLEVPDTSTTVS